MNILVSGKGHFASQVIRGAASISGVNVTHASVPLEDARLGSLCSTLGVRVIPSGALNFDTMPDNIDLIVCAHSHDFIGDRTRIKSRFGGIGFHPSFLPLGRGRDSIRWSIKLGERLTGGTVYRLSNNVDGGDILAQEAVVVSRGETVSSLWRDKMQPLGVRLLLDVVSSHNSSGLVYGEAQDEGDSTWFPSMDSPPLFKPDLLGLPHLGE